MQGRLTEWGKEAKTRLKGRKCYNAIFFGQSLAPRGERNSTLMATVGQLVSLLLPSGDGTGIVGTEPEHLYGLLLDSCLRLGVDDDGIAFEDKAWDMLLRVWALEEAKVKAKEAANHRKKRDERNIQDRILSGVAEWHDGMDNTPEGRAKTWQWVSEHLIASTGRSLFVLKPDGKYDEVPVTSSQLIARIRELGMDGLIQLMVPKASGIGMRRATAQELINDYATIVNNVEGVVGTSGGVIVDPGIRESILQIGLFERRTDIKAEWNDYVDLWLQHLTNDQEEYDKLCTWIGHALAFEDGPICALSLSGPPGCGKKLLTWGLAECVTTQTVADGREFGRFNPTVLKTPFLAVNEGFPKLKDGQDTADAFRAATSGDPIVVEKKFMDPILARNPLRVMLLANNLSVLQSLTGGKDLSPEDRDALAQRLFHINVPHDAGEYLRDQGGLAHTGAEGNRWIRSDSGKASDFVLAKHFLYLYENRPAVPVSNRFLVEGNRDADIIRFLATQSGWAPEVIEILVSMVEAAGATKQAEGIAIVDRDLYVTVNGVLNHQRIKFYKQSGISIKANVITSVLKGLVAPGWVAEIPRIIELDSGKKTQRSAWWKIKSDILYREAMDNGYRCSALENIVDPVDSPKNRNKLQESIEKFEGA